MNDSNPKGEAIFRRAWNWLCPWLVEYRNQLIIGSAIGVTMIGLGALYNAFERETPKWDLAGPPNGRPIRSIIYDKAAPLLSKNCERPKWQRWFYSTILGEECIRIVIDPPHLADMISKRMPFRESAEPYRLLELFIERHKGCLTLERDGEKAIIQEAEPSDIARADGKLVCP